MGLREVIDIKVRDVIKDGVVIKDWYDWYDYDIWASLVLEWPDVLLPNLTQELSATLSVSSVSSSLKELLVVFSGREGSIKVKPARISFSPLRSGSIIKRRVKITPLRPGRAELQVAVKPILDIRRSIRPLGIKRSLSVEVVEALSPKLMPPEGPAIRPLEAFSIPFVIEIPREIECLGLEVRYDEERVELLRCPLIRRKLMPGRLRGLLVFRALKPGRARIGPLIVKTPKWNYASEAITVDIRPAKPELSVEFSAPQEARLEESIPLAVEVSCSKGYVRDVKAVLELGDGIEPLALYETVELGGLGPGSSKRLEFELVGARAGELAVGTLRLTYKDLEGETHEAEFEAPTIRIIGPEEEKALRPTPPPPEVELPGVEEVPPEELEYSANIEDYEILELLGSGGFARVYKARERRTGRIVAIKRLKQVEELLEAEKTLEVELVEGFVREVGLWLRLSREGIKGVVRLLAYNLRPYPWIAMEYMPGGSLRGLVGKLSWREAVKLVAELAGVLHEVHLLGIRHFDIKPENILLDEQGRPHLTDFGLAKVQLLVSTYSGGEFFGTPAYAAPEQFASKEFGRPDHRTDIYQLGTVLYELLTGRPPFTGTFYEIMYEAAHEEPIPPNELNPEVPECVSRVVLKALAKRPEDRYEDALKLKEALEACLGKEALEAKRPGEGESSTYAPLADYLSRQKADRITLSFDEVERILGRPLPPSARKHRSWWANDETHAQARWGWLKAGWEVARVDLDNGVVVFERRRPGGGSSIRPHAGRVELAHTFDEAWSFLNEKGALELVTDAGTPFTARASITRDGRRVIRFFQRGREYGRCYECCWGHYYNCNRTRIGMYTKALSQILKAEKLQGSRK